MAWETSAKQTTLFASYNVGRPCTKRTVFKKRKHVGVPKSSGDVQKVNVPLVGEVNQPSTSTGLGLAPQPKQSDRRMDTNLDKNSGRRDGQQANGLISRVSDVEAGGAVTGVGDAGVGRICHSHIAMSTNIA
ncbi:hypothetical protein J6590_003502 [Homalodisca vitripennis]|nr:hypothetical protein J6590_003502 [Homalodisca vitripennis]